MERGGVTLESGAAVTGGNPYQCVAADVTWSVMNGMDLFGSIKKEHERIVETLNGLVGSDPNTRRNRMNDLTLQLVSHFDAEERSIYHAFEMQGPVLKSLAVQLTEEHRTLRGLTTDLRDPGLDDEHWAARLRLLIFLQKHHIESEEKTMFDIALEYFTQDEVETMTKDFEQVQATLVKKSQVLGP